MLSPWYQRLRALKQASGRSVRGLTDLVRVVEVGPRDGLQNVKTMVSAEKKIELVNQLSETGLRSIEVTSFVSPKKVPQMADAARVYAGIKKNPRVEYAAFVPNLQGLEQALAVGVQELTLFSAASETFCRKNCNNTIEETLANCRAIREVCKERRIPCRAVISCIVGCPYEGEMSPVTVAKLAEALLDMGCFEVGLGDTIGVATPKKLGALFDELKAVTGGDLWRFSIHCHDTYGQAMANVYECLRQGIRVFDSSVAGLGGCPYAPGATGNVATEDLIYLLHGEGMQTGVDLEKIIKIGQFISEEISQENGSKVGSAFYSKMKRQCG